MWIWQFFIQSISNVSFVMVFTLTAVSYSDLWCLLLSCYASEFLHTKTSVFSRYVNHSSVHVDFQLVVYDDGEKTILLLGEITNYMQIHNIELKFFLVQSKYFSAEEAGVSKESLRFPTQLCKEKNNLIYNSISSLEKKIWF